MPHPFSQFSRDLLRGCYVVLLTNPQHTLQAKMRGVQLVPNSFETLQCIRDKRRFRSDRYLIIMFPFTVDETLRPSGHGGWVGHKATVNKADTNTNSRAHEGTSWWPLMKPSKQKKGCSRIHIVLHTAECSSNKWSTESLSTAGTQFCCWVL